MLFGIRFCCLSLSDTLVLPHVLHVRAFWDIKAFRCSHAALLLLKLVMPVRSCCGRITLMHNAPLNGEYAGRAFTVSRVIEVYLSGIKSMKVYLNLCNPF